MVNEQTPLVPVTALNAGLAVSASPGRARWFAAVVVLVLCVATARAFTVGPAPQTERVVDVATPSARPAKPTVEPKRTTARRRVRARKVDRHRPRPQHRTQTAPTVRAPRVPPPVASPTPVMSAPAEPAPTVPAPRPAPTPDGFTEEFF